MAEIPSYAKEQIEKTDLHAAEKAEVLKVVSEALDVYMEDPEQHKALEQCVTLVRLSMGNDSGKRLIVVPVDVAMPRTKYSHKPCWFKLSAGGVGHYMTELFCQYSHILHLPDDIQPDWLAAAKRALNMSRSRRVRTTKAQKVLLRGVALRIKELQDRTKQQGKAHA